MKQSTKTRRFVDLAGQMFGRLTVLSRAPNRKEQTMFRCICSCGVERTVGQASLVRGLTKSCGCLRREINKERFTKHGMTNSRVYYLWCAMRERCSNRNCKSFPDYGGRGIKVCERWLASFEAFLSDMGEPLKAQSIERRDNSLGYSPENCYWADRITQNRNKRSNRLLTINGQTKCMSEWSESSGVSHSLIWHRLKLGWTEADAVFVLPNSRPRQLHRDRSSNLHPSCPV